MNKKYVDFFGYWCYYKGVKESLVYKIIYKCKQKTRRPDSDE